MGGRTLRRGDTVDCRWRVAGAEGYPGAGTEAEGGALAAYVVGGAGSAAGAALDAALLQPPPRAPLRLAPGVSTLPRDAPYPQDLAVEVSRVHDATVLWDGGVVRRRVAAGEGGAEGPLAEEGGGVAVAATLRAVGGEGAVVLPPAQFVVGDGTAVAAVDAAVRDAAPGDVLEVDADAAFLSRDADSAVPPEALAAAGGDRASIRIEVLAVGAPAEEDPMELAARCRASGGALFRAGHRERALAVYARGARAARADGANADTYVLLEANAALCHLKLGSFADAEACCSRALGVDASCVKAIFRRGQARTELGELDAAQRDLERALELDASLAPTVEAALRKVRAKRKQIAASERAALNKAFGALYAPGDAAPSGRAFPTSRAVAAGSYSGPLDPETVRQVEEDEKREATLAKVKDAAEQGNRARGTRAFAPKSPFDRDGSRAEREENEYVIREFEEHKAKERHEDWAAWEATLAERRAAKEAAFKTEELSGVD